MADSPVTATNLAQTVVDRAKNSFHQANKTISDATSSASQATEHAISVLTAHLKGGGVTATVIGTVLSAFADILSVAIDEITQAKKAAGIGVHDLIAALLSDSLLIEVASEDIPNAAGPKGQFRINSALGGKFLDQLKVFMGANSAVTGESAEAGAKALLGLGMQMSVNTGLMAILGGAVPFAHMDELKEIGEMLEKSLGLGRLNRQALRPYVRNLIAHPLDRAMRAKYRQDILGTGELVKALLRGGPVAEQARSLLAQHGLPEDQIEELIAQLTPRLSADELYTLGLFREVPGDSALNELIADGIPTGVATARLRVHELKRAKAVEDRYIHEVDRLVEERFIDAGTGSQLLAGTTIDVTEKSQYQQKWALSTNQPHKRLSHADVLFLFEAGQVTLDYVQRWAAAEGYSDEDQQNLLLLFELKATAALKTKSGGTAIKAAHLHREHTAYVTDQITGLWGREPSKEELDYWVTLLDNGDRTKSDFKSELKAIDASGPAIPTPKPTF
jgi:hypothetical protein